MDFSKYKNTLPYASIREDYDANMAYHNNQSKIDQQFKEDLFNDLGITGNPKANLLYEKAWANGHSYGYEDVYNCAIDLVDLIL